MSTDALFGMPIVTSRNVPPGLFFIIDRSVYTNMTVDELMVKIWVGDALKQARAFLASLVAEVESRWFGGVGMSYDTTPTDGGTR